MARLSPTILGRLLEEVSWDGHGRVYRDGGRGRENVLTAEVFQALYALPREDFLGAVVSGLHIESDATQSRLRAEVEDVEIEVLPGELFLSKPARLGGDGKDDFHVQPDAILSSPSVYALVEAKRLRSGSFQVGQLAKEL